MEGTKMNSIRILAHQLGINLKRYRLLCGYTQLELSKKADIHFTFVGHIERGGKLPGLPTLVRLAKALEIPVVALLKGI